MGMEPMSGLDFVDDIQRLSGRFWQRGKRGKLWYRGLLVKKQPRVNRFFITVFADVNGEDAVFLKTLITFVPDRQGHDFR